MQTHRGIYALKDFFKGGTASVDGGLESRDAVKEKIRAIIANEDRSNPLADDQIVEKLLAVHGLQVARRTVTKYRKALRIASSRQRREF
jgi:RNA polymerase sigma-54 factor